MYNHTCTYLAATGVFVEKDDTALYEEQEWLCKQLQRCSVPKGLLGIREDDNVVQALAMVNVMVSKLGASATEGDRSALLRHFIYSLERDSWCS